ncbi:MAG: flagellin [Fibrobacter sp.]|nr:flagellin [Fibrobacter sp.]
MRINASLMSQQSAQNSKVQRSMSKILEKLSTGKRINRASDDAAGLAVAKRLEAMTRGYKRAGANISDAMSALNIADGGANELTEILQRQRELATQASNGTLTDTDREVLDREYQQLNQELERVVKSTQFNTMDLLSGQGPLADGTGVAQVGPGATEENQMNLPATDMTAASVGWGGDISTVGGAQAALSITSSALDNISEQRSTIGAQTNRLESAYRNNSTMEINTLDAQSRLEDLDYAQGLMDLARSNILGQSGTNAQRYFMQVSQHTVMGLLQ